MNRQSLKHALIFTTAIFAAVACGFYETSTEEIIKVETNKAITNDQEITLKENVPSLTFVGKTKNNVLAPNFHAFNAKAGCKFEPGTSIKIERAFKSSFESAISYVFKPESSQYCPLDQGFIDNATVETNDIYKLLPENYALIAKDNRAGIKVHSWTDSRSPVICELEKGEPLLVEGSPKKVGRRYLQVKIVSKYDECEEQVGYINRYSVHLKGVRFEKADSLLLAKPFYNPTRNNYKKTAEKKTWIKGRKRNGKSIRSLGFKRNMLAFLDVIAYAEGTKDNYNLLYTFEDFPSFYDHPRRRNCYKKLCSDAAGRYQLLSNTWDMIRTYINLKDFGPRSQDLAAVQLIRWRRAAKLINNIRTYSQFKRALKKCSYEWASLPGSPYGQPMKSSKELWKVFKKAKKKYSRPASRLLSQR
jgi:muramidase (phage lysozyme)